MNKATVIECVRITPERTDEKIECTREYILETTRGFFWVSDGCRSVNSFNTFLDALRFSAYYRNLEIAFLVESDEIVGEVEAMLEGHHKALKRQDVLAWIKEHRQKCQDSSFGKGKICECEKDFFEWPSGKEFTSEISDQKIAMYLAGDRVKQ